MIYYDITHILYDFNFYVYLTSFEIYSYDNQEKNPISQEYIYYPVDQHVDICEEFIYSNYQTFKDEAKKNI